MPTNSPINIWFAQTWQDLRYAGRQLRRSPGFTFVAVATLAMAVGASTTIYSALDAAFVRPLPYPHDEQLVTIWEHSPRWGRNSVSGGAFRDWRDHSTLIDSIFLRSPVTQNLRTDRGADRINGREVSSGFLNVLGVTPLKGRGFRPEDDAVGGTNNVVLLTEESWRNRFGGDEAIIGRTVILDDLPREVVGILPAGSWTRANEEFFVPAVLDPAEGFRFNRGNHWTNVWARLKPGVTPAQLDAELNALKARLNSDYPDGKQDWGVEVVPLRHILIEDSRPALLILGGAVALVLLIACTNVANLLLARASVRQREIALRAALGAIGSRLGRQVLTESLLLAAIGGVLGIAFAAGGIRLLNALMSGLMPGNVAAELDPRVLIVALVTTGGTGLFFGALPAWKARRPDLNTALNNGGRSGSTGGRTRTQSTLVIAEIALTVVLLATAGLFLRSLGNLMDRDPGFATTGTLTFDLSLPDSTYPESEPRLAFIDQVLARVGSLPGVTAVGSLSASPLTGGVFGNTVSREDRTDTRNDHLAGVVYVRGDFFTAIGSRLLRGRYLTKADNRTDAPRVVVVDEQLARTLFPNTEAIGQFINTSGGTWEIVGVISNMNLDPYPREAGDLYLPQAYFPFRVSLVVRTAISSATVLNAIRREIAVVDAGVPLANVRTLGDALDSSYAPRRVVLSVLGGFAAAALTLACLGLYGVMAYTISQRRRELSIRLALGALGRDIVRQVLGDALRLTLVGLAIGLAALVAVARLLENQLVEVGSTDPLTLVATIGVIALVTLVACWLPARRAAKTNPVEALRAE